MTSKLGFHYSFLFLYSGKVSHSGVLDYDTVHYVEGTSAVKMMMSADPSETSVTTCHTLQEVVIQTTLHYFAAFIGLFLNGNSGMCLPLTERYPDAHKFCC